LFKNYWFWKFSNNFKKMFIEVWTLSPEEESSE
jgi:hypothetical protein